MSKLDSQYNTTHCLSVNLVDGFITLDNTSPIPEESSEDTIYNLKIQYSIFR